MTIMASEETDFLTQIFNQEESFSFVYFGEESHQVSNQTNSEKTSAAFDLDLEGADGYYYKAKCSEKTEGSDVIKEGYESEGIYNYYFYTDDFEDKEYYYRRQTSDKEEVTETMHHIYDVDLDTYAPTPKASAGPTAGPTISPAPSYSLAPTGKPTTPTPTVDHTCQNLFDDGCYPVCSGYVEDDCPGLLISGYEYFCDQSECDCSAGRAICNNETTINVCAGQCGPTYAPTYLGST